MMLLSLVVLLTLQRFVGVEGEGVYACEGEMLQFACTTGVLLIRSATYGRPMGSTFRCGESQNVMKQCSVDATQYLKYKCDGHPMCEIYVDVATFMVEMCPDVRKYVDVLYDCVPARTVETVTSCQQQCLPAPASLGTSNQIANKYSGAPGIPKPTLPAAPAGLAAHAASPHTSSSSSSSPAHTAHSSAQAAVPAPAPALPYSGPNLSRTYAAALANLQAAAQRAASQQWSSSASSSPFSLGAQAASHSNAGSSHSASSSAGSAATIQSASSRSALLSRMQTMLEILRQRKAAQG